MTTYRIREWNDRYEVDENGREWTPGRPKRRGALTFIRLKVHGKKLGLGWRRLIQRARKARALEVFGLFCKILEIAGDADRDHRNVVESENGESLDFILNVPAKQVEFGLQVLLDLGWIEVFEAVDSADFAEISESRGNPPSTQHNTTQPTQHNTTQPTQHNTTQPNGEEVGSDLSRPSVVGVGVGVGSPSGRFITETEALLARFPGDRGIASAVKQLRQIAVTWPQMQLDAVARNLADIAAESESKDNPGGWVMSEFKRRFGYIRRKGGKSR